MVENPNNITQAEIDKVAEVFKMLLPFTQKQVIGGEASLTTVCIPDSRNQLILILFWRDNGAPPLTLDKHYRVLLVEV